MSFSPTSAPSPAAVLRGAGAARRLEVPLLSAVPGLVHLFTVKGAEPGAALREASGSPMPLHTLNQVHGAAVRLVPWDEARREPARGPVAGGFTAPPEGDALATRRAGIALGVRVADCAPILIVDERSGALAAVHAGWRGTAAGVLRAAIGVLREALGARPSDLRVGIGPSIGPCCFEVGEEVVEALVRADPGAAACVLPGARRRVDLVEANRRQALDCGVPPPRIQAAGLCTFCRGDLLASYRRDRESAGRMAGIIGWRSRDL